MAADECEECGEVCGWMGVRVGKREEGVKLIPISFRFWPRFRFRELAI